jgi:hypothetical protein
LPAVEENNFFGKHSGVEPSPERASHVVVGGENGKIMGYQMASPGYAAVWATKNTREAIFDAIARRETYATTGSRMGCVGKDGKAQERVYDVAVSDDRQIDENGRCKTPVGNTVDVEKATWSNTIGDPELIAVWTDPDFDPAQRAFYYARVIEIPTPRWTAYEAKRFNVKMPKEAKMTTQERAYTSPIWYTPKS